MILKQLCQQNNLPVPMKEYHFHPTRKWRFDYAWPEHKICLEIEGGIFGYNKKDGTRSAKGAHSSVTGILRDIEKYNAAAVLGWRVLRTPPNDLYKLSTIELLKEVLK